MRSNDFLYSMRFLKILGSCECAFRVMITDFCQSLGMSMMMNEGWENMILYIPLYVTSFPTDLAGCQ
jgi:hypothetical protein